MTPRELAAGMHQGERTCGREHWPVITPGVAVPGLYAKPPISISGRLGAVPSCLPVGAAWLMSRTIVDRMTLGIDVACRAAHQPAWLTAAGGSPGVVAVPRDRG